MAEIDDPELVAQIVRQLNVKGPLQPFQIPEVAMPVFDIGRLTALDLATRVGLFSEEHLTSAEPSALLADLATSRSASPVAGLVLADTGQLTAGLHLINAQISVSLATGNFDLQWRNAANAATLRTIPFEVTHEGSKAIKYMVNIAAANERFRFVSVAAYVGDVSTIIFSPASPASIA